MLYRVSCVAGLLASASALEAGAPFPCRAMTARRPIALAMSEESSLADLFVESAAVDKVYIDLFGRLPANALPEIQGSLGLFLNQGHMVNGRPAYAHASRSDVMLWWMPNGEWCIGDTQRVGTGRCLMRAAKQRGTAIPLEISGKWKVKDNGSGWVDNVDIMVSDKRIPEKPAEPPTPRP